MKKLFLAITLVAALALSYWYGTYVGSYQTALNTKAFKAYDIAWKLEAFLNLDESQKRDLDSELNQTIIDIGALLESMPPFSPFFSSTFEGSEGMLRKAVEFRTDNPRVVDGVEYSPFRSDWRDYAFSAEYEQDLKGFEEAALEEMRLQFIEDSEAEIRRYNYVLNYFD